MFEFLSSRPEFLGILATQAFNEMIQFYLKQEDVLDELAKRVDAQMMAALEQIKAVMDDKTLEDPKCFERIDQIIEIFHEKGISIDRHDY